MLLDFSHLNKIIYLLLAGKSTELFSVLILLEVHLIKLSKESFFFLKFICGGGGGGREGGRGRDGWSDKNGEKMAVLKQNYADSIISFVNEYLYNTKSLKGRCFLSLSKSIQSLIREAVSHIVLDSWDISWENE